MKLMPVRAYGLERGKLTVPEMKIGDYTVVKRIVDVLPTERKAVGDEVGALNGWTLHKKGDVYYLRRGELVVYLEPFHPPW